MTGSFPISKAIDPDWISTPVPILSAHHPQWPVCASALNVPLVILGANAVKLMRRGGKWRRIQRERSSRGNTMSKYASNRMCHCLMGRGGLNCGAKAAAKPAGEGLCCVNGEQENPPCREYLC